MHPHAEQPDYPRVPEAWQVMAKPDLKGPLGRGLVEGRLSHQTGADRPEVSRVHNIDI